MQKIVSNTEITIKLEDLQNYPENVRLELLEAQEKHNMEDKLKKIKMFHEYSIWQNKVTSYWMTNIIDPETKKQKKIKRKKKSDLYDAILENYNEPTKKNHISVEEAYRKWIEKKLDIGEICRSTYDRYNITFDSFISGTKLAKMNIRTISEVYLEDTIIKIITENNLTQKGYSNVRTLIRGTFLYAKKYGYTNLSISVFFADLQLSKKIFRERIEIPLKEVYSEEDIPVILKQLEQKPIIEHLGLSLLFEAGIRIGELSALKKEDIDLEKKQINISRTESRYKDPDNKGQMIYIVKNNPKTKNSIRSVIITEDNIAIINEILMLNPDGEFLIEKKGKRVHGSSFNKYLYQACKQAGIIYRSSHKIRKTYATTLINDDVDDIIVMEQMGHADFSTTRTHYYKSNKSDDKKRIQIEHALSKNKA